MDQFRDLGGQGVLTGWYANMRLLLDVPALLSVKR
jgi:hypothetical protein